jgi:hypothetical protein
MMEAIRSSETSVLTRATRRHIQADGILYQVAIRYIITPALDETEAKV